ncbi:MAG: hypothetical protein Q7R87_01535 [Nanoarchaeota archaeon]|nr:hypothetical protein [Nanoarchaeota archaeon]
MDKKNINKKLKIDKDFIILGNRKFKINPKVIFQGEVEFNSKGAFIRTTDKHIGKRATVIIDKVNAITELSDEESKKLADFWDKHLL